MDYMPKMLPFLAKTHGLTELRAEQLWWDASRFARDATGEFDTPKYWKTAYERLITLIKAEAFIYQTKEAAWNPSRGLVLITEMLAEISANTRALFQRQSSRVH